MSEETKLNFNRVKECWKNGKVSNYIIKVNSDQITDIPTVISELGRILYNFRDTIPDVQNVGSNQISDQKVTLADNFR